MPTDNIQPNSQDLKIEKLGGLDIEGGEFARPRNSFQVLSNFELSRTGCIRKILGFELYNDHEYSAPIVAFRNYVREPGFSSVPVLVGFAQDGKIYDLNTGAVLAVVQQELGFPFIATLPTFSTSSKLEPDGAVVQQLYIVPSGGTLVRYDGHTTIAPVGVSVPTIPALVKAFCYVPKTQPDPDKRNYLEINVSRRYAWAYWNKTIRHSSSLSPVDSTSTIGQGGAVVDEARWYLTSSIQIPIEGPSYGGDYIRKQLFCTQDGGSEFFLIEHLYDINGNEITDADGSFPGDADVVYDGILRTTQPVAAPDLVHSWPDEVPTQNNEFPVKPSLGQDLSMFNMLIQPADVDTISNNPPPKALFGAVYQNRLWLVSADEPSKVVFSKVADFSSFPQDNYFTFLSEDADPIVGLFMEFASLIVSRRTKLSRITGTDFTDFTVTHLDQGLGGIGFRLAANANGKMYYTSQQGIFSFAMDAPKFESPNLKTLFDKVNLDVTGTRMMMVDDVRNGVMYTGLRTNYFRSNAETEEDNPNDGQEEDILLGMDYSEEQPFFVIRGMEMENLVYCMEQIEQGVEQVIFVGMGDNRVYRLGKGTGKSVATAITQPFSGSVPVKRKSFRYLKVEENLAEKKTSLEGFYVSFSVDGKPFRQEKKLRRHNYIGLKGRSLQIRFCHRGEFFYLEGDKWPTISNFAIEYVETGEAY